MKRFFVCSLITFLVPFAFWLSGFDFDKRGFAAFYCFIISLFVFVLAWIYPYCMKDNI